MSGQAANAPRRKGAGRQGAGPKKARCLVCGRVAVARFAPFCSLHCADVDLARWFDGGYAIPGREPAGRAPDDDDDDDDNAA